MKKTCELCRHEQLCRAIFGQADSILCGTTTFDFTDIEYTIDDFHDVLEFDKFLKALTESAILPEQHRAIALSCKKTFEEILEKIIKDTKDLTIEKFNALEGIISIFDKDVMNFFNLPKWFTSSEAGNKILDDMALTPQELELADLLCKEYEKQYEKGHC
jgi:hypothetical protein